MNYTDIFSTSKDADVNYLAKIITINNLSKHPNADKLQCTTIDGNIIIVGLDTQLETKMVYFPIECQIDPIILKVLSLYSNPDNNLDSNKKGFFSNSGRVKAIKLRGIPSEGFLIELDVLLNVFIISNTEHIPEIVKSVPNDLTFDTLLGVRICKKYIVTTQINIPLTKNDKLFKKSLKKTDYLIKDQFRFHKDTCKLSDNLYKIEKESLIHISEKVHGTSAISANVLCKKQPNIFKKILKLFGMKIKLDTEYRSINSSRKVIKTIENLNTGYYNINVWHYAHEYLQPYLWKGMTIYYEIIGYTPDGKYIQKHYDYGCIQPKETEPYEINKNYKIVIYRITLTNVEGNVIEFSPTQLIQWCTLRGLQSINTLYFGKAVDLYPSIKKYKLENWRNRFIDKLRQDINLNMEGNLPNNSIPVPFEGIVIRLDSFDCEAYKLKCFRFLEKESLLLDENYIDIETNQIEE
jgi:tRNA-binding EMAP/Myf-like protein